MSWNLHGRPSPGSTPWSTCCRPTSPIVVALQEVRSGPGPPHRRPVALAAARPGRSSTTPGGRSGGGARAWPCSRATPWPSYPTVVLTPGDQPRSFRAAHPRAGRGGARRRARVLLDRRPPLLRTGTDERRQSGQAAHLVRHPARRAAGRSWPVTSTPTRTARDRGAAGCGLRRRLGRRRGGSGLHDPGQRPPPAHRLRARRSGVARGRGRRASTTSAPAMSGLSDHRPCWPRRARRCPARRPALSPPCSRARLTFARGRRHPGRGPAGLRAGGRDRPAGRWSTGCAAACRRASCTRATTCPRTLLDEAYGMLAEFFSLTPTRRSCASCARARTGRPGYTGLLVETAASSDVPDWKEMLNWGREAPDGHPLRTRFPHRYGPQVLPEGAVPGISDVLNHFHDRIADLQRRFLRIIAVAIGCHEEFFDADAPPRAAPDPGHPLPGDGARPGPGPRVGRRARRHQPDHRAAPGQRPRAAGPDRRRLGGRRAARGPGDHQHRDDAGAAHQRRDPHRHPPRRRRRPGRSGERYSVVQFCHPTPWTVLAPVAVVRLARAPAALRRHPAGDRLDEVLWEINLVEDGRRVN